MSVVVGPITEIWQVAPDGPVVATWKSAVLPDVYQISASIEWVSDAPMERVRTESFARVVLLVTAEASVVR